MKNNLENLAKKLKGDLYTDKSLRTVYATDASAYREMPLAVVRPKGEADIIELVKFANANQTPIIPRAAGTSLAGQVVGNGIVADVSKYMNNIIEINSDNKTVKLQPGVVRDELNNRLKINNLFFSPETSTSNRCTIGGMLGNNACGTHSLVYGSTRDHIVAVRAILADGSIAEFRELNKAEFQEKTKLQSLEGEIYRNIENVLSNKQNQANIIKEYPHPEIKRRNTGYALDILLDTEIFSTSKNKFNLSKLIAGSEGTLAFVTEIILHLNNLPPKHKALVAVHTDSLPKAYEVNLNILKHKPVAIELMDDIILEQSQKNKLGRQNSFFVKGTPKAILMAEFAENTPEELDRKIANMKNDLQKNKLAFHFPTLKNNDIKKAYNLRKAGLGLLQNMPGDAKPVAVIEDTAVRPCDLANYMHDFNDMLKKHQLSCVHYAHISTGELHLRPVINLKTEEGNKLFKTIALETALLVKKYKGSLSGEHGDGRLRGEFISIILGEENYKLFESIKKTWDKNNILNPGKITNTPPMNKALRYMPQPPKQEIKTIFDFSKDMGYLRSIEKCTGSGDCRKSAEFAGAMCPSYQATKDEYNSTRARANILREYITKNNEKKFFISEEIIKILDLCLSCKACKNECPANVDMTKIKAEAMQIYYAKNGVPFRSRIVANYPKLMAIASLTPAVSNFFISNKTTSNLIKRTIGFTTQHTLPQLYKLTLRQWANRNLKSYLPPKATKQVVIFSDEFTNYNDAKIGISVVKLLCKLCYTPIFYKHEISGRSYLSKGMVAKAKKLARKNIELLHGKISSEIPLVGIEPSAILTFRDEYTELFPEDKSMEKKARKIVQNCFTFEEFVAKEFEEGEIATSLFTERKQHLKFHAHCYQKALSNSGATKTVLEIPKNYTAEEIPSGCCGMAGSFGFEKEHAKLSRKIGELVVLPAVRNASADTIIVASGTSCRHQIEDYTAVKALHPAEVLLNALNDFD